MTKNSTDLPWEENFTEEDAINIIDGVYTFQHPLRFTSNPSQKKQIGLRRATILPWSGYVEFTIQVNDPVTFLVLDEANLYLTADPTRSVMTLIAEMCQIFNTSVPLKEDSKAQIRYSLDEPGKIHIAGFHPDHPGTQLPVVIKTNFEENFAKLFNQEYTQDFHDMLNSVVSFITLDYKCERNPQDLYVHSSFSDQRRQFMCKNDDHLKEISVMFKYNGSDEFKVWFTDSLTKKKVILHGASLLIQLCYITNYDDTAIL